MGRESDYYEPLMASRSEVDLYFEKRSRQGKGWKSWVVSLVILIQFIALGVLSTLLLKTHHGEHVQCSNGSIPIVYSPAQEAVKYELRTFHLPNFNLPHYTDADRKAQMNIYMQPPSLEVDEAWSALYNIGITKLHKEEAARLPNKTLPVPNDPGYYPIAIDVFHQLHCLNLLRQALFADYYPSSRLNTTHKVIHASHCIDSIRQSLMCTGDISSAVWTWDEKSSVSMPNFDVVHVCKNFDLLREWAEVRRAKEFDTHVYPGEPVGGSLESF